MNWLSHIPPKLIDQSTDGSTGDEEMNGDITASCVVNKDGLVQVLKSVSESRSTDDDLAEDVLCVGVGSDCMEFWFGRGHL